MTQGEVLATKQRVCRIRKGTGEPCSLGLELTDEMETSGGAQVKPSVRGSRVHGSFYFPNKIPDLQHELGSCGWHCVCILGSTRGMSPPGHSHGMTKVTRSKGLEALKTSAVANSASSFGGKEQLRLSLKPEQLRGDVAGPGSPGPSPSRPAGPS